LAFTWKRAKVMLDLRYWSTATRREGAMVGIDNSKGRRSVQPTKEVTKMQSSARAFRPHA
jgi:hypothetical protein